MCAKFKQVLDWVLSTETVYENKHQKGQKSDKQSKAKIAKASSNLLSSVAYKYSKQAMEAFFRDDRLFTLFKKYAELIKREGYNIC